MEYASSSVPSSADPARRRLLQGLAALAGISLAPLGVAQSIAMSRAQAQGIQQALLGVAYRDASLTDALLRALESGVGAAPLARVAQLAASTPAAQLDDALRTAGLDKVAVTILVALASGVVDTPQGAVVITYGDALAWQMVPWTKPNAYCGGLTDYWAAAPAGKA